MTKSKKTIAFYLPQFHAFKENDEWWGKGFTEWTNTTKAQPQFKGHYQPRTPWKENYYNLLDESTIENQMNLANKYGLYGFCYYHYWFDGKLLMEQPLHIMKNISNRIPYCFCWANEPWTRAWDGNNKEVLMEQIYRGIEDWKKHFDYLLEFFSDEKYIKIENKPVFVIYRSNHIPDYKEMVNYFDNQCKENGFSGIYMIEELNSFQNKPIISEKQSLYFEPMYTLNHGRSFITRVKDKIINKIINKKNNIEMYRYSYKKIWKNIIRRSKHIKEGYVGAFVDWDNTARRGKKATAIYGATPSKFKKYFSKLLKVSHSDYIFLNAWNEWAEGAYMEPDEKYGFGYLEAFQQANESLND